MYKPEEEERFGHASVHSDESDDSDAGEAGAGAGAAGAATDAPTAQDIANIHLIMNATEGKNRAVANPMDVYDVMQTEYAELFRDLSERIGIESLINCIREIARTRSQERQEKRAHHATSWEHRRWLGIPDDERSTIVEEPDKVWLAKVMHAITTPEGRVWNAPWDGKNPANLADGYNSMSLSICCPLTRYKHRMQEQPPFRLWESKMKPNIMDELMQTGRIFLNTLGGQRDLWVKLEDADYHLLRPFGKTLAQFKDAGRLASVDSKTFDRHYRAFSDYMPSGGKKRVRRPNKTRRPSPNKTRRPKSIY